MAHEIVAVRERALAYRHGIRAGDVLHTINGEDVIDQIDYQALTAKPRLDMMLTGADGAQKRVQILKSPDASLGLTFDDSLMCKPRSCKNKCVFCFIDQMPPNLRDTLYVKDDDWRLSLMMGNYITLTNVDDAEFERVLRRKASPLYISVHATNPAVRVHMMKNPAAAQLLPRLERLRDAGLKFHCQIVLCPGFNDGAVLDETLETLSSLYPAAQSAALVPVGLTRFRDGLAEVKPYTQETAQAILQQAAAWQQKLLCTLGTRFVFPADEFYCLAQRPYPDEDAYEGYPQIENGVGLLSKFEDSLRLAAQEGGKAVARRVLIACGTSVAPVMRRWMNSYCPDGVQVAVQPIRNTFFGETVTVTGLLTGGDLKAQLQDADTDEILLCGNTLRNEGDLFLDDMPLSALREALPARLTVVPNEGAALYDALMGNAREN